MKLPVAGFATAAALFQGSVLRTELVVLIAKGSYNCQFVCRLAHQSPPSFSINSPSFRSSSKLRLRLSVASLDLFSIINLRVRYNATLIDR